ncbi:hypothetical protein TNCV_458251 [Trichonephila clavipes]|nr:hypothetical protein TNCV_458251 [Trichonephila clavipes]
MPCDRTIQIAVVAANDWIRTNCGHTEAVMRFLMLSLMNSKASGWLIESISRNSGRIVCNNFMLKDPNLLRKHCQYAHRTGRPIIENVDKIPETIEVDRYVSSRSTDQELIINYKTVLNHLSKDGIQKETLCLGATPINTKKHDGSNYHLRSLCQTE